MYESVILQCLKGVSGAFFSFSSVFKMGAELVPEDSTVEFFCSGMGEVHGVILSDSSNLLLSKRALCCHVVGDERIAF